MKVVTPFNSHVPKGVCANLRWRAKVHRKVLDHPSYADIVKDACSRDPLFFINGFTYTHDTRREPFSKLPFILYPFQEEGVLEIISAINDHDLLIEKSRDMGASWITLAAIFWCWRFRSGRDFLLGSRNDEYVDKSGNPKALFQRLDFLLDTLPIWLIPIGFNKGEHRTKSHLENPENGSVIDGEATTENFSAGDRRSAILLDEFAKVKTGHQILSATMPATNCRLFNSTPLGTANAFYDLTRTNIKKLRLHWSSHPIKSRGLYTTDENGSLKILNEEGYPEGYNPILDGKLRSPWYDDQCERALSLQVIGQELDIDYLGSGYQYFNSALIDEAIRKYARPPIMIGDLEHDETTGDPIRFRENPKGNLKLWCLLDKKGNPLVDNKTILGNDISAGTGASNSCASGWNALKHDKILEYVNPFIKPEPFAIQSIAIAKWLGNAFIIWESNGVGRQFGSRVMELHYSNVYLRRNDESIKGKVSDIPGWASTKETKLVLMGSYRSALEKGECINYSKTSVEETLEYVFSPDGGVIHARASSKSDPSGAKTNHGDRVMADALANKGMSERVQKTVHQKQVVPVGSLAWRNKMREKKEPVPGRELSESWR